MFPRNQVLESRAASSRGGGGESVCAYVGKCENCGFAFEIEKYDFVVSEKF